jgi:hypothetical protein
MGNGSRQPYIYNPPARYEPWDPYGGFNPKAVSQASVTPIPQRPKHEGPLLNFDRHPDSYGVQTFNTSNKQLHPETATWIGWAKKMLLAWRFLQLLLIAGTAVCVITLQGLTSSQSWIIRLPVSMNLESDQD